MARGRRKGRHGALPVQAVDVCTRFRTIVRKEYNTIQFCEKGIQGQCTGKAVAGPGMLDGVRQGWGRQDFSS